MAPWPCPLVRAPCYVPNIRACHKQLFLISRLREKSTVSVMRGFLPVRLSSRAVGGGGGWRKVISQRSLSAKNTQTSPPLPPAPMHLPAGYGAKHFWICLLCVQNSLTCFSGKITNKQKPFSMFKKFSFISLFLRFEVEHQLRYKN